MSISMIQITDLHLSDLTNTPAYRALLWAVEKTNACRPDFVVVSGDMTTCGTEASATAARDALLQIVAPVFFTPGNAEHRDGGALPILAPAFAQTHHQHKGVLFLFPDTSRGSLSADEREGLVRAAAGASRLAIVTHFPIDTLDDTSRAWITQFLADRQVELYVAGHKHIHRTRQVGTCVEMITRGLDPDKASGHLPGISRFERSDHGHWTESFLPWPYDLALLPCDLANLPSPVGWSIQGDPIAAARETLATDLNVLEIRPNNLGFSAAALKNEISALRNSRRLYLSWHLPALSWRADRPEVAGVGEVSGHLAAAREIDVDHLTVHVPQLPAHRMDAHIWAQFEAAWEGLFSEALAAGICLAIENIHNDAGVQPSDPACKFATDIDGFLTWISAMRARFAHIPNARVGAHLDVGHARNNGELGNIQPLGDWYARIGEHILGYHIHQIRTDPHTRKTANHREMFTLFDLRISYAGFFEAWSRRQINRAPLFVEIRDAEERRRSTERLRQIFRRGRAHQTSLDLVGPSES